MIRNIENILHEPEDKKTKQKLIEGKLYLYNEAVKDVENEQYSAEDMCMATGYLIALGAEDKLPQKWEQAILGKVGLTGGELALEGLKDMHSEIINLVKEQLPLKDAVEEITLQKPFGHFLDAQADDLLRLRINAWATSLAIERAGGQATSKNKLDSKHLQLLHDLDQEMAKIDDFFSDPIISIWIQEDIEKVKKEPLFSEIIKEGAIELPKIFNT